MVKTVLSVSHLGLRDWIVQRLSAIYMFIYIVYLAVWMTAKQPVTFDLWHGLFATQYMKIASLLFIFSILSHAWVGIWTVLTDYVKCKTLRAVLNTFILFILFASFIWGFSILWSA